MESPPCHTVEEWRYSPKHLAKAAAHLNNRHRLNLNDDTPAQRFTKLLTIHH